MMKKKSSNNRSSLFGLLKKMIVCCGAKSFSSDHGLPAGHVRVYVGIKDDVACKFELEANYLNHPLFESLLQLSVEEFGYSYSGALRIACEMELFRYLLHLLKSRDPLAHYMELQDLISNFYRTTTNPRESETQCLRSTSDHNDHILID